MQTLLGDLRHALRSLSREPLLVGAALLALALGVGLNTAVFSVVQAVLLRPLPFADPDRLVTLWDTNAQRAQSHVPPSPGNFLDWERETGHFSGMAIWYVGRGTLRDREGAEVVQLVKVTPGFFDVLGVAPLAGRVFHRGELQGALYNVAERNFGGDRRLVVSERFWRRRLAADPAIAGRTLSLDGAEWIVEGVVPEQASLLSPEADLYVPWDVPASYVHLPGTPRDFRFVHVVARLAGGATLESARDRMRALAGTLAAEHPKENRGWSVELVPLAEEVRGPVRGPLLLLLGATCTVLLVACLDVATLQTARAAARARDLAVRSALGASRLALFRSALLEGLLLAGAGTAAGLLFAYTGLKLLLALSPWQLPGASQITLDATVLAGALAAAVVTAVVFGAAPLAGRRVASLAALGARSTPGRERQRLRRTLVALQIAVSLVLLTAAGLFARSFAKARAMRPGFDGSGLLVMRISLDKSTYLTGTRSADFYQALTAKLEALPGVVSAAGTTALPMSKVGIDFARPYWREGEGDPGGQAARAQIRMATPRYFETMRMPVLRGRAFTPADRRGAPMVIAINETLARRAFAGEDPVGQRLVIDYQKGAYPYEVVALVADARFGGLKSEPVPEVFLPHLQNPYLDLNIVIRTSQAPRRLAEAARRAVREVDPSQPVHSIVTMDELLGDSVAPERFFVALFGLLSSVAAVLAATGLYGLLAYLVKRRAHEIGVRQALGARAADVLRLVLLESGRLTAWGAALGLALSVAGARAIEGLLFQVVPADPLTLAAVAAALGLVVLAATALPARTATRVSPAQALRAE